MTWTDRVVITSAMAAFLLLFLVVLWETVSHR